jgi:hypothetical protein
MVKLLLKFAFIFSMLSYGTGIFPATQKPENCENLICVRKNIDILNEQIVELLAKRMTYVYQATFLHFNAPFTIRETYTRSIQVHKA